MNASNLRHAARVLALQVLYEVDLSQHQPGNVLSRHFVESAEFPDEMRAFASELVSGVTARRVQLDERIGVCAPDFPVDTLAAIDRNVLRIALFELERGDVPVKATVNEAVELAKEFGGDAAPRFINGVLASAIVRYHSDRSGGGANKQDGAAPHVDGSSANAVSDVLNVSDRDQASNLE
jgi:transcription antitermination protein NusB